MSKTIERIGVFDSGLGGLTVLRELVNRLPQIEYFYLGDTARTPYGPKSKETVIRYARECAKFLLKKEIDLLVVACNTVSAYALDVLQSEVACPVVGTIEMAVNACRPYVGQAVKHRRPMAVIGTAGTISSRVYQENLLQLNKELEVISVACPLFVPLVEEGMLEGRLVDEVIEHYLGPLRHKQPLTIILACTHYPLLRQSLQKYMGPQVSLLECSSSIADGIVRMGIKGGSKSTGKRYFYATDSISRFNALASLLLKDEKIEALKVEELV